MRPEKWQRNQIFESVTAGGLDARDCRFDYDDEPWRISHTPSGSHFILGSNPLPYAGSYVVGDSAISWPFEVFIWARVPETIKHWAAEVKRDFDTPDLWGELQRERDILTGARSGAVENTPFTPDEQVAIAKELSEIKGFVKRTYSLSNEQMLLVDARFDVLEEATRRLGRKDWLLVFWGVMFSVIVTSLLPPEAVQHIVAMALQGLGHLFAGWGGPQELGQ